MRLTKHDLPRFFLLALFLFAVAASVGISSLKRSALGFHARDEAYYAQFAAKLLDPSSAKQYSLNPEGENWLFMRGLDGEGGFQRSIHLEPVKYVYAGLWLVFGSPVAVYWFIAFTLFSPLLYLFWILGRRDGADGALAVWFGVFYTFFPSMFFLVSYDLRPYIFLAPFLTLAMFSIVFKRSTAEKLIFFNLLFLAREEALVLAGFVLVFTLLGEEAGREKKRTMVGMLASYAVWDALSFVYFRWTGFPIRIDKLPFPVFNPFKRLDQPIGWLIIGAAALTIGGLAALWAKTKARVWQGKQKRVWQAAAFGSLLIPLVYQLRVDLKGRLLDTLLYDPRYTLQYVVTLILGLVLLRLFRPRVPSGAVKVLLALGLAALALTNLVGTRSIRSSIQTWSRNTEKTADLWRVKAGMDNGQGGVLVDFETYQAFCELENVYVLERLPDFMVEKAYREYPANIDLLEGLLAKRVDTVVISSANKEKVERLFPAGAEPILLFENSKYIGYQLR